MCLAIFEYNHPDYRYNTYYTLQSNNIKGHKDIRHIMLSIKEGLFIVPNPRYISICVVVVDGTLIEH